MLLRSVHLLLLFYCCALLGAGDWISGESWSCQSQFHSFLGKICFGFVLSDKEWNLFYSQTLDFQVQKNLPALLNLNADLSLHWVISETPFLVFKLKAGILRGFLPESFLSGVVQPNTRFRSHKGSSCKYLITFLCTALSPPDPKCPTSSLDLTWHPQCDDTTVFCLDSVSFYYGVKGAHRQKSDLNTGLKLFFFFFQELYFCTGIRISWFHSSLQQKACPVPVSPLW